MIIAIYLALSLLTFLRIWQVTDHHFTYSLDDAYIHLALARGLTHGTYSINAGETESPSSSVLWPFILTPLVRPFGIWAPLILNTIFSILACLLLGRYVQRWFFDRYPGMTPPEYLALAGLVVVAANLIGLTFMGMEHVLQIVLVVGCCAGLMEAYNGRPVPGYALAMATLAPSVRYEDLALTFAIALTCLFQRRRLAAALVFALSLVPLLAMALFLHLHGLPFLPNSALAKAAMLTTRAAYTGPHPRQYHPATMALINARNYLHKFDRIPITLMALALAIVTWLHRHNRVRFRVLLSALFACGLMMALGPYGAFFRYDTYLRLFLFLILLATLPPLFRKYSTPGAFALALLASALYLLPLLYTPDAAHQIFCQQGQMARFARDFYGHNVAVNDIGEVSFEARQNYYVFDLYGLSAPEPFKFPKTTEAMDQDTRRHHIGLVMMYDKWFPPPPDSWQYLGDLELSPPPSVRSVDQASVSFYATQEADILLLRTQLADFARTLPPGAVMNLATPPNPNTSSTRTPTPSP